MNSYSQAEEPRTLIQRCLAGESDAIASFQMQFGELIYGYPRHVYRLGYDSAGDFYLYAFESGRIFRRTSSYEGRAPFRAYLLGFVLDHLFIDWRRSLTDNEPILLEDADRLPVVDIAATETQYDGRLPEIIMQLDEPRRVLMKLLHVGDYELTAAELRSVAQSSRRTVGEVIAAVEGLRRRVSEREAVVEELADSLGAVHAWIRMYERRLNELPDDSIDADSMVAATARRLAERKIAASKLQQRLRQRDKLLKQSRRRVITAPYKDIAEILNTTVGSIAGQVARLRADLAKQLQHLDGEIA